MVVTDLAQSDHDEVRLVVDARWGRSGIASALMQATLKWAVMQRRSELRFICPRNNWAMRSLLEESGARLDLAFGEIVARLSLRPLASNQQAAAERFRKAGTSRDQVVLDAGFRRNFQ